MDGMVKDHGDLEEDLDLDLDHGEPKRAVSLAITGPLGLAVGDHSAPGPVLGLAAAAPPLVHLLQQSLLPSLLAVIPPS